VFYCIAFGLDSFSETRIAAIVEGDEEMPGNADWERDASGEAHWTDGARLPAPPELSLVPRAPRPGPPFFLFYLALRGGPALARAAVV
jgi:hypothetical protein